MIRAIHISERGTRLWDIGLNDLGNYSLETIEHDDPFHTGYGFIILVNGQGEHVRITEHSYRQLRQEDLDSPLVNAIDKALSEYTPHRREFTADQLRAMREDAGIED